MKKKILELCRVLPGIFLPAAIAALSMWIESLITIHLIGSAVIAMFIGIALNPLIMKTGVFSSGVKFTSKKLLKFAIILLGLSLNIRAIMSVGKLSLLVMAADIFADVPWALTGSSLT